MKHIESFSEKIYESRYNRLNDITDDIELVLEGLEDKNIFHEKIEKGIRNSPDGQNSFCITITVGKPPIRSINIDDVYDEFRTIESIVKEYDLKMCMKYPFAYCSMEDFKKTDYGNKFYSTLSLIIW